MQQEPDSALRAMASREAEKRNKKKAFEGMLVEEADGGSDLSSRGMSLTCSRMRSLLLCPQKGREEELMSSQV